MKIHVMWFGGDNYTQSTDLEEYMEEFPSVMSAAIQLYNRARIGGAIRLPFNYIKSPGDFFVPGVHESYMLLYKRQPSVIGVKVPFAKLYLDENGLPHYQANP